MPRRRDGRLSISPNRLAIRLARSNEVDTQKRQEISVPVPVPVPVRVPVRVRVRPRTRVRPRVRAQMPTRLPPTR